MLWEKPNINTFCLAGREGLLKRETFLSGSFLRHCRLTVSDCFHCLVVAWTVYPLHLTPALAFSGLVRGVRWWHLVKERSWDLDLSGKACCAVLLMASGPFFVELTGGEGSVHHGGWKGFFLQLGAIHVCWIDQKSLGGRCAHWTYFVTRGNFIEQSIWHHQQMCWFH